MKAEQEVWKVVRKSSFDSLQSAVTCGPLCLPYQVGESTRGYPGTPCLAFDNLSDAIEFAEHCVSSSVYRCTAKRVRKVSFLASLGGSSGKLISFWKDPKEVRRRGNWILSPSGTVACDEITLLEEIPFG